MATDYDAPRSKDDDQSTECLEHLHGARGTAQTAVIDINVSDTAEGVDLPGAGLSKEELVVTIVRRSRTSSPACPASWCATAPRSRGRRMA